MALVKHNSWTRRNSLKDRLDNPIVEHFHKLEGRDVFPYNLAWECLAELQKTTQSQEELLIFMLEDILFTSLYATFYESLLFTIHHYPDLALELIDQFEADSREREQQISEQVHAHFNYIENHGKCPGCAHCQHHSDVDELIEKWEEGDMKFFRDLYIGMNTIQYTMEHIIYDVLPFNEKMISHLTEKSILQARKAIYAFAEHKLYQARLN
ncbi:MAG: hypothetical protein ACPGJV_00610 [Bacteriovoracaceae bacterium]